MFEDNEAVIKMIIKGRSPTMRHVSRTHRDALDGFFIESIWTPRFKSNTLTPNQLANILTKGNFTRDEWNHLLCLFNISYFSSTNCLEVMSKRTQKDAGEERVTAKSKPMMNSVSRCSVRDPDVLGLRMDGTPTLTLWDLVIEVLHRGNPSAIVKSNMHDSIPIKHTNVIPTNIGHIPSNTKNSDSSAMLYVFEDNEAVSKMIIKGRSPTMRHVSRTHRVALDWLFDRMNLNPKIPNPLH